MGLYFSKHPERFSALAAFFLFFAALSSAAGPAITETTPLPDGRHFHGAAVLGDHLYVFGGALESLKTPEDNDMTPTVMSAPIAANSQIGQWRMNTSMPEPRLYIANSTIVLNDVVYIIGGVDRKLNGNAHNTAIYTKPMPDGTLLPWMVSGPFGSGLNTPTAVTTPGYLHVIGGVNKDRRPVAEVWSNALFQDGSLGNWEPGPALPTPLWFHQAGVAAGRVYVWGGLNTPGGSDPGAINPIPAVFSAPVLGSGRIGPWRPEKQMLPTPFYSGASATAGHYLLTFSGRYQGGVVSSDIWWTYATPDGLRPWQPISANIPNRLYHAVAPDYRRGSIYIPGGRMEKKNETPTRQVFFFTLSGDARAQAEATWQKMQAAHSSSAAARTVAESGVRQLTYVAESELPAGAVPGFKTVTDARRASVQQQQPLVLYFNYRDAQPCKEQNDFLQEPLFQRMLPHVSFGWVDTTEYPQMAQQMGVYRVPTWIIYDRKGNIFDRRVGVVSTNELADLLRKTLQ